MLCAMQLDKQELFDELYSEKWYGWNGFWASEPKGKYGDLLKADPNQRLKIGMSLMNCQHKRILSVDGLPFG